MGTPGGTPGHTPVALEPIGYDSQGSPLYSWQLNDEPQA
jgi:hypothetical protein